jgi:hypothetical protein
MVKKRDSLDRFYTKPEVATSCLEKIDLASYDSIVEPSSGNGAFSNQIKDCISIDIDKDSTADFKEDFLKKDFFLSGRILTIGNPPFGTQNSMAKKFLNHAAIYSTTIAFILSNSFKKVYNLNTLNSFLHLREVFDLPKNSFLLNGEEINLPCSFFVFDKKNTEREKIDRNFDSPYFAFVKKEDADFMIRRCGGSAGKIYRETNGSPSSNLFIKSKIDKEVFFEKYKELIFEEREWTIGPKSVSKYEIAQKVFSSF